MKRKISLKVIAVFVILVMILSLLPTVGLAAKSLTINAVQDLIPGGANVSFYDDPASGSSTRGLEKDGDVVILRNNEWLKYDISSLDSGEYIVYANCANTSAAALSLCINDEEVISKAEIKHTSSYFTVGKNELGRIKLSDGKRILTVKSAKNASIYFHGLEFITLEQLEKQQSFYNSHRPYKMSYVPCAIEAEHFDSGINGIAYSDTDSTNKGAAARKETAVDVYDKNGKVYVNLSANDWVKYTFSVRKEGDYNLFLNWVDPAEMSKVRIFADNYEVIRVVSENQMAYEEFKETSVVTLRLKAGVHNIVVKCLDGDVNIDYLRLAKSNKHGLDISKPGVLRKWEEAQELSEEDYSDDSQKEPNPIEREIFVVSGAKGGNGSIENPFGNILEARDYVRTINDNMKGDIVVNLKGEFKLSETLKFTNEDSGTNGFNVIYKGDDALIHGGRKVEGFKKVEGTPLYQTTLSDANNFRQFYVGDNRAVRSRSKWMYYMLSEYDEPEADTSKADGYIMNGKDFPNGFVKPYDMEFVWHTQWNVKRYTLKSLTKNEEGNFVAVFPAENQNGRLTTSSGALPSYPYYIENAPEFLDEPGEFYFNKDTKVLTYYPRANEDLNNAKCYIPHIEKLIDISGESLTNKVKNITFSGISFKYGNWEYPIFNGFGTVQGEQIITPNDGELEMVPAQVQVHFGENINFYENEFTQLGSCALSYSNGSIMSEVTGNLFDDISASAITVGDWNLTKTSTKEEYARKIKITNNLIRRPSVEYMTPVISVYQTNNVIVDHNDIKDAPISAVSCGWGWGRQYEYVQYNHITNNRIDNSVAWLIDGAAIYTLDSNVGGRITGNYLTDSGHEMLYHDNSSANWTSTKNVFDGFHRNWLKITFNTIKDNTSYGNYSDRRARCTYPDQNDIRDAIGKVNGVWPQEAQKIINNSGLTDKYRYLLDEYESKEGLVHSYLSYKPNPHGAGIYKSAGRWMDGGEGVGYHDILHDQGKNVNALGEPTVWQHFDGSQIEKIGTTDEGEWIKYAVEVPETGYYDLVLEMSVVQDGTCVSVEVDDKPTFTKVEVTPNCKDYDTYKDVPMGKIYLEKGTHTFKVEHAVKNFAYRALRLIPEGMSTERLDTYNRAFIEAIVSE